MINNRKKYSILFFLVTYVSSAWSMVCDNRYFPWYQRPFHRTADERSRFDLGLFFTSAGSAVGDEVLSSKPIPELWGIYDQKKMSNAIIELGMVSPLLAQWQIQSKIDWVVNGSVKSQGIYFYGEYDILEGLSVGGSVFVGHFTASQAFVIPRATKNALSLTPSQEAQLDQERREMFEMLGFQQAQWSVTAPSDIELHIRYGTVKEYVARCRTIDIGTSFFVYVPTAPYRNNNLPAAVPIGGNRLVGIAWGFDGAFELKEDLTVGLQFSLIKRLSKTQQMRMPIQNEPYIFGAIVGPAKIDTDPTIYFNPYITLGSLRPGFSGSLGYTVAYNGGQVWTDKRLDKTIPTTLNGIYKFSEWCAEYINILLAYDFNKVPNAHSVHPVFTATWDIPLHFMGSHDFARTQMVTVGMEFRF